MKGSKGNPIAAVCAVVTLLTIEIAIRHCMRKYGR